MFTAVARKRHWSFCQKCRWQVTPKHAYTLDPEKSEWADYAAVQAEYENLSGSELTRNLSGNTRPQSSQPAKPLWTNSGLKSEIDLRVLISTLKRIRQKRCRREMNDRTLSQYPHQLGHHHVQDNTFTVVIEGGWQTLSRASSLSVFTFCIKLT